jgi:hypothetical protein
LRRIKSAGPLTEISLSFKRRVQIKIIGIAKSFLQDIDLDKKGSNFEGLFLFTYMTPTQAPRYAWANRVAEAKEEMK